MKEIQLSFDEVWGESEALEKAQEVEDATELKSPIISDIYPVTLVRDFDIFLDYIRNHSVSLTKTKEYISRKYLPALNECLSVKNEAATSNTEQEYYPYIHFFYYLAFSGRLLKKGSVKAGKMQVMETDRLRLYKELTDIEKYFFLLETFWVDVNWGKLLDTQFYRIAMNMEILFSAISEVQPKGSISEAEIALPQQFYDFNYLLLYFEWLGFWKCEVNQEQIDNFYRKNSYFAKSITLTNFGAKLIPLLFLERNLNSWNITLRRDAGEINPIPGSPLEDMMLGNITQKQMKEDQSSQPFFQPFVMLFPEEGLKRTLPRNTRKFFDGIYTYKVFFSNSVWRKVVLSGKHTMHDLHRIILDAFDFDEDHLYSFFMDGKKWSDDCVVSPYDNYGHPNADKVKIGDINFDLQQRFLYLYDYGDEWTFVVEVDQMKDVDSVPFKPYVKEGKGKAPVQYY